MSTRSLIGIWKSNNVIEGVYCHFDGYPENQIPLLQKYSREDIRKMISNKKGLISLGESPEHCKFYEQEQTDAIDLKFPDTDAFKAYDYIYGLLPDGSWKYIKLSFPATLSNRSGKRISSSVVIRKEACFVKI